MLIRMECPCRAKALHQRLVITATSRGASTHQGVGKQQSTVEAEERRRCLTLTTGASGLPRQSVSANHAFLDAKDGLLKTLQASVRICPPPARDCWPPNHLTSRFLLAFCLSQNLTFSSLFIYHTIRPIFAFQKPLFYTLMSYLCSSSS